MVMELIRTDDSSRLHRLMMKSIRPFYLYRFSQRQNSGSNEYKEQGRTRIPRSTGRFDLYNWPISGQPYRNAIVYDEIATKAKSWTCFPRRSVPSYQTIISKRSPQLIVTMTAKVMGPEICSIMLLDGKHEVLVIATTQTKRYWSRGTDRKGKRHFNERPGTQGR